MLFTIMQTVFDAVYLIIVFIMGVLLNRRSRGEQQMWLFGAGAVVLAVGEAFRAIPSAYYALTGGQGVDISALGFGELISAVTVTLFYWMLYYAWRARYHISGRDSRTVWINLLVLVRIVLCVLPQNGWLTGTAAPVWAVVRSIPLILIGLILTRLYAKSSYMRGDRSFGMMGFAVLLSCLCHVGAVLLESIAGQPQLLVIPQSLTYMWILWMSLRESRRL